MIRRSITIALLALLLASCDRAPLSVPVGTVYVASHEREPFHRLSCESAYRISDGNLQTFTTRQQAIDAGHRPCKRCKP